MDDSRVEALQAQKKWQEQQTMANFEALGIYGTAFIVDHGHHWFTGEFKMFGQAGLLLFSWAEGHSEIEKLKQAMFSHLKGCGPCAAALEQAKIGFEETLLQLGSAKESIQQVSLIIHQKFASLWLDQLESNTKIAFCAYLNSTHQPEEFIKKAAGSLELIDYDVQILGKFSWAPGYLSLAHEPRLRELVRSHLANSSITPSKIDNSVFVKFLNDPEWSILRCFVRALSPGAASRALVKRAFESLGALDSKVKVYALLAMAKHLDFDLVAAKFSTHTVAYPDCTSINSAFVAAARDSRLKLSTLIAKMEPTMTAQVCTLELLEKVPDRLEVAQQHALFLFKDAQMLNIDSLRQLRNLINLEVVANDRAVLLEASMGVFSGEYTIAQAIIFEGLKRGILLAEFCAAPDNRPQEPRAVARAIIELFKRFSTVGSSVLTTCCNQEHFLSVLWLYDACTEPTAKAAAKTMLRGVKPGELGVSLCFKQYRQVTDYIIRKELVMVGANAVESMMPLATIFHKASLPDVAQWWQNFWQLVTLEWSVEKLRDQKLSNSTVKIILKVFAEAAFQCLCQWTTLESRFADDKNDKLRCVCTALEAGRRLLFLQRSSNILQLVYAVFEKGLRLLDDYSFPLPLNLVDTLTEVVHGTKPNEVTPAERAVLGQYVNKSKQVNAQASAVSAKSSAPAPKPVQTSLDSFTKPKVAPPYTSSTVAPTPAASTAAGSTANVLSFFKKVPREEAVAATIKQMPPKRQEAPQEMSRLEILREQMSSKRVAPSGAPAVVHPARPAGFNRKEREKEPRPAGVHPPTALHPHPVPSQDDSDSSSGDEEGLIQLGKRRVRAIEKPAAKRSLRPPQADEKSKALARMKARLLTTAKHLYKHVLQWDYFQQGDWPPDVPRDLTVPDKFVSSEQYLSIMRPLLLMETWAHIQQQKETREPPYSLQMGKRETVDDFVDVFVTMTADEFRASGLSESDLVLVAEQDMGRIRPQVPHSLAKIKEGSLHIRNKQADFSLRLLRSSSFHRNITTNSSLLIERIDSMTTVEREWCALESLPHSELRRQILDAEVAPLVSNPMATSQLSTALGLNSSQAAAVYQATNSTGFSLVQGPPGTGKTKTVLGMIGTMFSTVQASNKRVLVCAPSNAAVDELLMRLKAGVITPAGQKAVLKMVRIGNADKVHPEVQDLLLDSQIELSVAAAAAPADNSLKSELAGLQEERKALYDSLEGETSLPETEVVQIHSRLGVIKAKITEKRALIDRQREQLDLSRKTRELEYKRKQAEVICGAQIVCATLSGSAHPLLSSLELQFDTVIIDEAAQCVELSALIPMRYGATTCIMVGDPHQLPPTVLSRAATGLKYEQSLFTRIFNQWPSRVSMLDVQFRMHPEIAAFPSREFYDGKLQTGERMEIKTARPWHAYQEFPPYRFYNCADSQMQRVRSSWTNQNEVKTCVQLVKLLLKRFPSYDFGNKIGIVTPYKQQNFQMRDTFKRVFGDSIAEQVSFSTIDAFQGQEKDIIIFSTVRAAETGGIGFVGDVRRMNVAITRARASLWIVGTANTLGRNDEWDRLLRDADDRGFYKTITAEELASDQGGRRQPDVQAPRPRPYERRPEPAPMASSYQRRDNVDRRDNRDNHKQKRREKRRQRKNKLPFIPRK